MNEQQIRQIVQQEIQASKSNSRFGLNTTQRHTHNGIDSPRINQYNLDRGTRVEGSITFQQQTVYKIATNFNPTAIWFHGNVTGDSGEKFLVVGNAQLGGQSYYLQPGTSTSVTVGGPPQTIIQSTSYFGTDSGGTPHTLVDEGHTVDIEYPRGTIHTRATITGFNNQFIIFDTTATAINANVGLAAGWTINLSFTIT